MPQFPTPARGSRQIATAAALLAALTAVVAGCGSDKDQATVSATPVVAVSTSPDGTSPAATEPGTTPIAPSKDLPQHAAKPSDVPSGAVPKPPSDSSKINTLKAPSPADKLIVKSHTGVKPVWRVAAQMQGTDIVCVAVSSLGQSTPQPNCQTGSQLALELLTSAGGGEGAATVAEIQRSVRNPPSDVLVSGATTGNVQAVYVEYLHKKYKADLSKHTVSLPVKLDNIKTIAGAKAAAAVPNPLTVKVFGVSLPKINGNPPTTATLKGQKPKHGALTFELS